MRVSSLLLPTIAGVAPAAGLDTENLATQYYGNDAPWYQAAGTPYFECSDSKIQDVFYYRWKIFRAHQRDNGATGYITTEFANDVGWQLQPWASLNDATGFHIAEGRWVNDRRFTDDYINFMLTTGADRHFTDYMASSIWDRYLVDGDSSVLLPHLDRMISLYDEWNDHFNASRGLYWIEPLLDATEYTISSIDATGGQDGFTGGYAYRPSINSYMWANFRAIAQTAALAGQTDVSMQYTDRAATLKTTFQSEIWNTTLQHFIDRHQRSTQYVTEWDPIRGRELVGMVPWMFSMPDNTDEYTAAWKHVLSTDELRGSNGLRTNEPTYEYYMRQYRYDGATGLRECQWNGPVWPFQTTQVLTGMANLLNSYNQSIITKDNYLDELRRYTDLHYLNGSLLDLQEDYEPDKPGPIVGLPRSDHYFHSGYNDLIITGLVGLRPRADNTIEVNSLVPASDGLSYFRLQNITYHGHDIAVQWDQDGSRYGQDAGLRVEVDGEVAASSKTLTRLTAEITGAAAPAIVRRITKSTQLNTTQYPMGSASSGNTPENVHGGIDGRIMFFPEETNGWDSNATAQTSTQWFAIDFGSETSLSGAEIAFYADADTFALPQSFSIQRQGGSNWTDIVSGQGSELVANGVANFDLGSVSTRNLRLLFQQAGGKRTRLVEFKAF